VDIRPEVEAVHFVADARALPAEVGEDFDLILFDPPHKNNAATGKMAHNYGHWTAEQIRDIVTGSAKEAHRVALARRLDGVQVERPHAQAHQRACVALALVGAAIRSRLRAAATRTIDYDRG
jgi:16S rRNA G966 N2-methylase RsmD